jgi:NYN domain
MEKTKEAQEVRIAQSVAILIDGNNIERSLHKLSGDKNAMLNFDSVIPKLLDGRGLTRLIYFREGVSISEKLAERLHFHYHGSVMPCHKSADIPLTIKATQIAQKVDTIIVLSGDSDYVELVRHLRGEGVRVEIAAVEANTAAILVEEADHFTPITEEDFFTLTPPKRVPQKHAAPKHTATRHTASKQTGKRHSPSKPTASKKTTSRQAASQSTSKGKPGRKKKR